MPSYLCPVCSKPLNLHVRQWQCADQHGFDMAKEGYVNLLLANRKNSRDPGDNADMLRARREFLDTDLYRFLPQRAVELISTHTLEGSAKEALDIGSGEGYYTGRLSEALPQWQWHGVDISKPGVRMAAKRYKKNAFAVASNFQLPLLTGSQSTVTQIFAPASTDEVARILEDKGLYLTVNPAQEHLWELKQHLYETPQKHEIKHLEHADFELTAEDICTQSVFIEDNEQLQKLFAMTPFYWNVGEERQTQLAQLKSLRITLSFHLAVYRRKPRSTRESELELNGEVVTDVESPIAG